MKIRPATLTDIDTLAAMNLRLIQAERHPNPLNQPQLRARMHSWLETVYQGYLALEGGIPIAYCLYRNEERYYYLRHLYVEQAWRRQGVATRLLDWMFRHVWADKKVRLDVLAHNHGAVDFYTQYGFHTAVLRMEK